MSAAIGLGEALALQRRHPMPFDLGALYARVTDGGARTDTLLLESPGGTSFLLERAAIRAECRGSEVRLSALSYGGRLALKAIARDLSHRLAEQQPEEIRLVFPRCRSVDAEERLIAPSPFDALRSCLFSLKALSVEERFTLFAGGIVAFDHVDLFEDLPPATADSLDFPDYIFWIADSVIVVEQGSSRIVCTAFGSDDEREASLSYHSAVERLERLAAECSTMPLDAPIAPVAPAIEPNADVDLPDQVFAGIVMGLKGSINRGDIFQAVPSRTFRIPCSNPLEAYRSLRQADESPYHFFVAGPDHCLFGASPETSVRVARKEGWNVVEVKPIAGTRPRGATQDEDDRLEADLRLDEKEMAEHMMLVDLARNDVARVSIAGTRRVAKLLTVERFARVMHLVSSVKGCLAIGLDALHALQSCLNVGTLTGAPKLKAMEILRLVEGTKRGPYGGAVGWIAGNGELDTAVIIRSAVVKDGMAHVRVGAGVVFDSDPVSEAEETRRKASSVLSAIARVEVV